MDIVKHLYQGDNISKISKETGHGRNLIRKIKKQLEMGENVFRLNKDLGAPRKRTPDLEAEVIRLTILDRRAGLNRIANNISANERFPTVCKTIISNILKDNNFKYLQPRTSFCK